MNFLLHLHLAARDLGSRVAGAGAMLPDLWRMADRRVRAARERAKPEADGSPLAAVLAGIEHHVAIDRWFHDDVVFQDGERETAALLRDAQLRAPRSGLFAHVLWELCLDGALLRREGVPTLLGAVREGLAPIAEDAGARAVYIHHFGRIARTADERAAFDARMAHILTELARGPWIEGYTSGAGIAARLQGVRRGLGLPLMDAADLDRLGAIAEELLARAPAAVERIERAAELC